jgi:hypothetical protein
MQMLCIFYPQGYKVVAVELSVVAIEAFFNENAMAYTVQKAEKFSVYNADNIRIFCGDYFDLLSINSTSLLFVTSLCQPVSPFFQRCIQSVIVIFLSDYYPL